MTSPHTHPAERETPAGEAMREAVARAIRPVAFNTEPAAYGLDGEDDPRWKQTLTWGARMDAYERADALIAGPIASELSRLTAERDEAREHHSVARDVNKQLVGEFGRLTDRALAAEAALTTLRADHAAEVARKDAEIARLRGRNIDAFGIAIHALEAGAPGIKPPTRDAIARNFALRVRAALAPKETTDA